MTDEHVITAVKDVLEGCRGRDQAITSQELSEQLGGIDNVDSTPKTRSIIRDVMQRYNLPIAGSPDGYFIIQTGEEYRNAQNRLSNRIDGIKHRKTVLQDAWEADESPNPQKSVTRFHQEPLPNVHRRMLPTPDNT